MRNGRRGKGLVGRNANFQSSTAHITMAVFPVDQSPIKYSITIFSHFCPCQPWEPKGLASMISRGNVSSSDICGDGRTYWKSKQEQKDGEEVMSLSSGLAPLWPGSMRVRSVER